MNILEFQSIIPANNIVSITKGIASFFVLLLNDNELRLAKYTEERNVIWNIFVGSYEGRGGGSVFSVIEDEESYIYVVANYTGVFKPYIDRISEFKNTISGAVVVKLNNWGNVVNISEFPNISNFSTFMIFNHAWMASVYRDLQNTAIQIQNLSTGGKISHVRSTGFIQYENSYHIGNKLFLVGNVCGTVSYRNKSVTFQQPTALLLIIDTLNWELIDYYRVQYIIEENVSFYLTGVIAQEDVYYIAGYTNSREITIYHRDELLRTFTFDSPILVVCRLAEDINIFHINFNSPSEQRLNFIHSENNILLQGIAKGCLLHKAMGLNHNSHYGLFAFILRFNENINLTEFISIGSGVEGNIRAPCDCGNCGDDDEGMLIPCRPMRLFNGKVMNTNATGGCGQGGSNGNTNIDGVYVCEDTVKHCYAAQGRQPGDLYTTKYSPIYTAAEKQAILAPTESINGLKPVSGNMFMNKTILNYNNNVMLGFRMIDNLVINNNIERKLYRQKWFGFLLNFQYVT